MITIKTKWYIKSLISQILKKWYLLQTPVPSFHPQNRDMWKHKRDNDPIGSLSMQCPGNLTTPCSARRADYERLKALNTILVLGSEIEKHVLGTLAKPKGGQNGTQIFPTPWNSHFHVFADPSWFAEFFVRFISYVLFIKNVHHRLGWFQFNKYKTVKTHCNAFDNEVESSKTVEIGCFEDSVQCIHMRLYRAVYFLPRSEESRQFF